MKLDAVSSVRGCSGHKEWRRALDAGMHVHVTLDGVHQGGSVIAADASEGWVRRTKITGEIVDGRITPKNYQLPTLGERTWPEETVRGTVTIEARPPTTETKT